MQPFQTGFSHSVTSTEAPSVSSHRPTAHLLLALRNIPPSARTTACRSATCGRTPGLLPSVGDQE